MAGGVVARDGVPATLLVLIEVSMRVVMTTPWSVLGGGLFAAAPLGSADQAGAGRATRRVRRGLWSLGREAGVADRGGMTSDTGADPVAGTPEQLLEIEPARCRQLLEAVPYGRLATVDGGEPLLAVVNHVVDAGDIYVRTRRDSRLARLTAGGRSARAVYEVDSAFP